MSGFLYQPKYFSSVAWSVKREASSGCQTGTAPIQFDSVHVDTGGVWDPVNNKATCTESGFYLIALIVRKCASPYNELKVNRKD